MASNLYRLTVRRGPEEGQSFTLSENSITVGRDPMTDIVLRDPEVSRQHARFTRTGEGYQIQDLGSTNGTFVEGRRLAGEAVPLSPGTVVTMGSNVTLIFEAVQDQSAAATAQSDDFDTEDSDVVGEPTVEEATQFSEEGPAARVYDMPEAETEDSDVPPVPGYDPTEFDFPTEDEPQELSQVDTGELPSFDSSSYEEAADEEIDVEPVGAYDFQTRKEESELPTFDDDEYELPSFDAEPEATYEAEQSYASEPESIDRTPPPPPPPAPPEKQGRNRNLIIATVTLLLLLCCCCLLLWAAWTYGDLAVNYFGIQLQ